MVKEISSICEIKHIREQKSRLSERERELTQPILSDLELISKMYEHYTRFIEMPSARRAAVRYNQQFAFVMLFLYSPSSLAGGEIRRGGLRDKLADIMGFKSHTGVTKLCKDVMFNYNNYKIYRMEIDYIYTRLTEYVEELTNQ